MSGKKTFNPHIWEKAHMFPISKYTFWCSFPERNNNIELIWYKVIVCLVNKLIKFQSFFNVHFTTHTSIHIRPSKIT